MEFTRSIGRPAGIRSVEVDQQVFDTQGNFTTATNAWVVDQPGNLTSAEVQALGDAGAKFRLLFKGSQITTADGGQINGTLRVTWGATLQDRDYVIQESNVGGCQLHEGPVTNIILPFKNGAEYLGSISFRSGLDGNCTAGGSIDTRFCDGLFYWIVP